MTMEDIHYIVRSLKEILERNPNDNIIDLYCVSRMQIERLIAFLSKVDLLRTNAFVDREDFDRYSDQYVENAVKDDLSYKFAKYLIENDCITYATRYHPDRQMEEIIANVVIVKPKEN